MSVLADDLMLHGCANMPQDDVSTVGGSVDTSIKIPFINVPSAMQVQIVSSNAADVAEDVIITYRNTAGVLLAETINLNGQTPVGSVETDVKTLLKAVKQASTVGKVAVEGVTATRTGTAVGGAARTSSQMAYITLDSGASGSDDTYNGQVLRLTSGVGAGQIAEILKYRGSDKRAWVRGDWSVVPTSSSVFRICPGMVFDRNPVQIMTVQDFLYDISSDPTVAKDYYVKLAMVNHHATLALTGAIILETDDPSGIVEFGLAATLDDSGTSTNRLTTPGGITFNSSSKPVANSGNHSPGSAQGIWIHLPLVAGAAALSTYYQPRETGASVA